MNPNKALIHFSFLLGLGFFISCGKSPFLDEDAPNDSPDRIIQGLDSNLVLPVSNLEVASFWQKGPLISDESKILFVFTNKEGVVVDPKYELKIKLWMPTMGHGSFPVSVKKISVGVYQANDVYFTMEGYWDIHIQLFQNNKLNEEVKWGLTL